MTAIAFGFLSTATAIYRDDCGCTLTVDASIDDLLEQSKGIKSKPREASGEIWPHGETIDYGNIPQNVDQEKLTAVIEEAFQEPGSDTMRNTQAIVVVYRDRIIAEKYEAAFSHQTPMLGWSMTKSITNALMGILVGKGKLDIMQPAPVEAVKVSSNRGK